VWDAATHAYAIVDLDFESAAAQQGWQLICAADINDDGLIVGIGTLNGILRGFLLDRATGAISPVPLDGIATSNLAFRINAFGHVVGYGWTGNGQIFGTTTPDYVRGYFWDGSDADPVVLDPVTDGVSQVRDMNDVGAAAGTTLIPGPSNDPSVNQYVPTLWEFDAQGDLSATNLRTQIPSKPAWFLWCAFDVNNDGWVSVRGRKYVKGKYYWPALLLIPSANSN